MNDQTDRVASLCLVAGRTQFEGSQILTQSCGWSLRSWGRPHQEIPSLRAQTRASHSLPALSHLAFTHRVDLHSSVWRTLYRQSYRSAEGSLAVFERPSRISVSHPCCSSPEKFFAILRQDESATQSERLSRRHFHPSGKFIGQRLMQRVAGLTLLAM